MQRVDGEVGVSGLQDVRADLGRAISSMFAGGSSAAQRLALIDRLYAKVGLVHLFWLDTGCFMLDCQDTDCLCIQVQRHSGLGS